MRTTRWTVVALVVPTIAALGIACDQRTPTETLRPDDARATASRSGRDSDGDNDGRLRAVPFVFVGTADQCGGAAGSSIVTAAWLGGMGLPDNGGPNSNVTNPANNPNKNDPHLGLLLSKNGPTPDCSSSGARIMGVRGMGAGPTFVTKMETFHFVGGCANSASTPAEQDLQWSQVRFTAAQQFPPIPPGSRIQSISILYDEGTDTPSANALSQEPSGVGLAVIDNIFIDGKFIRRGRGIAEPHGNRGDRDSDKD
jgi:hypothetical protein